jgi:hypothetical protein
MSPDEPAFVLIINEVQGITCPGLLDLFNVFFECHLISSEEFIRNNEVGKTSPLLEPG